MTIHHQHISTTHKANITRALQGALQTLFVPDPRERAENFSENVADHATNLSGDAIAKHLLSRHHPEQASRWRCAAFGGWGPALLCR